MDLKLMQRAIRTLERALSNPKVSDEVKILAAGSVLRLMALDLMRNHLDFELESLSKKLADIQRRLGRKAKCEDN